jgi:hypothetical protein
MRQKYFTVLLTALCVSIAVQADTITIQVIATYDCPHAASTFPQGINNNNQIVGSASKAGGSFGFIRAANGQFSEVVDPDDTHMDTSATGLNGSGTVCGSFFGDTTVHGFFLSDGTYTTYDVPGETYTAITGINNAGDFVGTYFDPVRSFQGFTNIGGTVTTINIPDATNITPLDLNSRNQVVGSYVDSSSNKNFAFFSDRSGQLHYRIRAPGAIGTLLYGINDQGVMVGSYVTHHTARGQSHGFVIISPNLYATFDYPGSTYTVLTGINDDGFICGYYVGAGSDAHGLLLQAQRTTN